MLEPDARAPLETLTTGPVDRARDRWLERTVSAAGARLAAVRDAMFDAADVARHHVVLDLAAGSGLLTWEALRRAPEGWSSRSRPTFATRRRCASKPRASRNWSAPLVLEAEPSAVIAALACAERTRDLRFDRVLGRSTLRSVPEPARWLAELATVMTSGGSVVLAETDASRAQRLSDLLDWSGAEALGEQVLAAEAALYEDGAATAWTPQRLRALAREAGWSDVHVAESSTVSDQRLAAASLERWLGTPDAPGPYVETLRAALGDDLAHAVARRFRAQLTGRVVPWRTTVLTLRARLAA
jgi:putative ATPase